MLRAIKMGRIINLIIRNSLYQVAALERTTIKLHNPRHGKRWKTIKPVWTFVPVDSQTQIRRIKKLDVWMLAIYIYKESRALKRKHLFQMAIPTKRRIELNFAGLRISEPKQKVISGQPEMTFCFLIEQGIQLAMPSLVFTGLVKSKPSSANNRICWLESRTSK